MPEDTETNDDGLPKIKKGSKIQLEAEIEPENTTYKDIAWSVSDETIATVDENGVLHGLHQHLDNGLAVLGGLA